MRRVKLTWAYTVCFINGVMLSIAGIPMTDWRFWAVLALGAMNAGMMQL